jgi:ion channel POLLUX/CASTOR
MATPLGIRKLMRRAFNRFRFEVGQYLLRGTFYRLLVIVSLVAIIALVGGLMENLFDPSPMALDEGTWWAFLRLTDPGYLGDDQGFFRRTVSTIITVVGYVLFLGALVAIMTQWLNQTLRQLESGLTPIARDGHVLVAGWTDRTLSVLREMFRSEDRSHSLLGGRGSRLTAVVLADNASPELHQQLRDSMGEHFHGQQIILRQGEAIHLDHLRRADFAHASAIVLPGEPYLGDEHAPSDVRVMKTLMSIARHVRSELGEAQKTPLVVAELFDARREQIAKSLYPGRIEVVVSDRLIGRMLALNLRHAGLAHVYRELLFEREGQRLSKTELPPALIGKTFHEAVRALSRIAVLGVVRAGDLTMCPEPYFHLLENDALIVFGREHDELHHDHEVLDAPRLSLVPFERARGAQTLSSLLILGWTRKVPMVLSELIQSCPNALQVKVLSTIDLESRKADLAAAENVPTLALDHVLADYTVPEVLKSFSPALYDAVLLVGSDRLESGAESDARSIVGCEVLRSCLVDQPRKPRIVIELMDPDNAPLLEQQEVEVLVSPQLLGRALAQVALVPDLCAVYDDLFGAGGAELSVHPASEYGIDTDAPIAFGALRVAAARMGHVLLGAQAEGDRSISMNPPPETELACARDVRVVVAVRTE